MKKKRRGIAYGIYPRQYNTAQRTSFRMHSSCPCETLSSNISIPTTQMYKHTYTYSLSHSVSLFNCIYAGCKRRVHRVHTLPLQCICTLSPCDLNRVTSGARAALFFPTPFHIFYFYSFLFFFFIFILFSIIYIFASQLYFTVAIYMIKKKKKGGSDPVDYRE